MGLCACTDKAYFCSSGVQTAASFAAAQNAVTSVRSSRRGCEGAIRPRVDGSDSHLFLLSHPERPPQGPAPGCFADLRRGDGVSAENVPEHGGLGGRAGGCLDGSQHPGRRSVSRCRAEVVFWGGGKAELGQNGFASFSFLTIRRKNTISSRFCLRCGFDHTSHRTDLRS